MTGQEHEYSLLILLVGVLVCASVLARAALARIGLPAVVGYLLLGLLLSALDRELSLLSPLALGGLRFLSNAGLVALLFLVGLQSDPAALRSELRHAGWGWVGSVLPSALLGFLAARHLLGLDVTPSLVVATALTATSIGVSMAPWEEFGAVGTRRGALLLDIAELDDISGVIFMAVLLALLPVLAQGAAFTALPAMLVETAGALVLKFLAFAALCLLFARYLAHHIVSWSMRIAAPPYPMLMVGGIGFAIAAIAGWMGFSLAIGAVLAGLAFAGHRRRKQLVRSLRPSFEFFVPFFFIGIGLDVDTGVLGPALGVGAVLLVVAVVGKVVGTALAVAPGIGWRGALEVGASMAPRAEIAMVIMEHGRQFGVWAVPDTLFAAMALVSIATCAATPVVVRWMLRRWPTA